MVAVGAAEADMDTTIPDTQHTAKDMWLHEGAKPKKKKNGQL